MRIGIMLVIMLLVGCATVPPKLQVPVQPDQPRPSIKFQDCPVGMACTTDADMRKLLGYIVDLETSLNVCQATERAINGR